MSKLSAIGTSDPCNVAEAAPWGIATHPGGIFENADTIIWWHFTDARESPRSPPWDSVEREALASNGCPLDDPEREIRRVAAAWERPLLAARKRLILVRPLSIAGEQTAHHPLWHRMAAGRKDLEKSIEVEAEQFLHKSRLVVADRKIDRSPVTLARPLEFSRSGWKVPAGLIQLREQESASSLTALIGCPFQWTLRYAGHLRPSLRERLPRTDQIIGTLAHLIADRIFDAGSPPDPGTVQIRRQGIA